MKIGDYVRTINGKIWIIRSQKAISGHKKDIINYSENLIDLIEEGDYVNGHLVIKRHDDLMLEDTFDLVQDEDIKSIVTKEQFESMKYEVK